MESCLVFGPAARFYLDNRLGRLIGREEALEILDRAEASGLVLQPSNAQKVVNICTCCGCCCQILKNLKAVPNPARYVASNYYAEVSGDRCAGCGTCVDRCPMEALAMMEDVAAIDRERCIGCGCCVPTCPEQAITLRGKPDEERTVPPGTLSETMRLIAQERVGRWERLARKQEPGSD
jgi:Na+-translocating ferredoxin:NAD+ oxidoreductase subunit B